MYDLGFIPIMFEFLWKTISPHFAGSPCFMRFYIYETVSIFYRVFHTKPKDQFLSVSRHYLCILAPLI